MYKINLYFYTKLKHSSESWNIKLISCTVHLGGMVLQWCSVEFSVDLFSSIFQGFSGPTWAGHLPFCVLALLEPCQLLAGTRFWLVSTDSSSTPTSTTPALTRSSPQNRWPLTHDSLTTAVLDLASIRMGLVNARSLSSLRTSLRSSRESSAISELLPCDCLYFNSPWCPRVMREA